MDKYEKCELCGREDTYLNFHHLIPKMVHNRRKYERDFEKDYLNEKEIDQLLQKKGLKPINSKG